MSIVEIFIHWIAEYVTQNSNDINECGAGVSLIYLILMKNFLNDDNNNNNG